MDNNSILVELKAKLDAAEAELTQAEELARRAREQSDRLRTAYQVLEEMMSGRETASPMPMPAPPPRPAPSARTMTVRLPLSERGAGLPIPPPPKFRANGPTVEERAVSVLRQAGEFLSTQDLVDRMQANGYKSDSKGKVYDTVYGTLDHARKKKGARLVRKDAKWGLSDWLPAA